MTRWEEILASFFEGFDVDAFIHRLITDKGPTIAEVVIAIDAYIERRARGEAVRNPLELVEILVPLCMSVSAETCSEIGQALLTHITVHAEPTRDT